jgi:hypothetical protein
MLEAEVQVVDALVSMYHEDDPISEDWCRIKTALAEAQNTPANTQRDAIIAEAVEAWREWDALPEKMFTDRLVNAMHALSELYPKQ